VEVVDAGSGKALRARNGAWIITADHGNAEA
jgi:bisphosphoglycerate-independent phosphoglycerate mutase (AlkP superfamily)